MELPVDAPVGEDVRTYLSLDDASIEVDLAAGKPAAQKAAAALHASSDGKFL